VAALTELHVTPAERLLVLAFRARTLDVLRGRGLCVYLGLLRAMPMGGSAFYRLEALAELAGVSERTAQRGAAECQAAGVVERQWHGDDRGCLYHLMEPRR
jgi:hypothetical protein